MKRGVASRKRELLRRASGCSRRLALENANQVNDNTGAFGIQTEKELFSHRNAAIFSKQIADRHVAALGKAKQVRRSRFLAALPTGNLALTDVQRLSAAFLDRPPRGYPGRPHAFCEVLAESAFARSGRHFWKPRLVCKIASVAMQICSLGQTHIAVCTFARRHERHATRSSTTGPSGNYCWEKAPSPSCKSAWKGVRAGTRHVSGPGRWICGSDEWQNCRVRDQR